MKILVNSRLPLPVLLLSAISTLGPGCSGDAGEQPSGGGVELGVPGAGSAVPGGIMGAGAGSPGAGSPGAGAPDNAAPLAPGAVGVPGVAQPAEGAMGTPVAGGLPLPPESTPVAAPAPEVVPPAGAPPLQARESFAARLTRLQYRSAISDVVSVQLSDAQVEEIPADATHEDAFVTWAAGQNFSSEHVEAYSSLARQVAEQVEAGALFSAWSGCAETTPECTSLTVAAAGLRFFRRPLRAEEQSSMEALFASTVALEEATFDDGADVLLRMMLQAPQFLYRLDDETLGGAAGSSRGTTGPELAARLAFFLWQSTPDEELLNLAQAGPLDAATLEQQVERLLADPRAERSREAFWRDYTLASFAAYPNVEPQVAADMRRTVVSSITRVAGQGAAEIPLPELFTMREMVLSPALAEHLDLDSEGAGDEVYDLSSAPQRVGILTHPGYLSGMGSTSFVGRGKAMSERILCRTIPDPPPGLEDQLVEVAAQTEGNTPREASEFRFGLGGTCLVCHQHFEPIAMAFEQFDMQGRHTEEDAAGRELLTSGYLQDAAGVNVGDYEDVAGLMALIAARQETEECFAENLLAFATGLKASSEDAGAIAIAHEAYKAQGLTFSALRRAIAMSPQLQTIAVSAP